MRKAVFLDRDGVLNEPIVRDGNPHSPGSLDDFRIIEGTGEALGMLRRAGYLLIVATNQPEVVRGLQQRSGVEGMHDALRRALPLDDIFTCYHDAKDGCACRKPEPGLIVEAARKWGIRLDQSYMIGDRWKDVEAGRRAGCHTVLLAHPYNAGERQTCDYRAESMGDAASWILSRTADQARSPKAEMGEPALVTVMMPAYNAEPYIAQSIESVLAQSYSNWELIIVNDGSSDNTGGIAAKYRDPRVRVLAQPNGGEASARNTALKHARGQFLAFLDADDLYLPEHLEAALSCLDAHPEYTGAYTDGVYIDANGRHLKSLSSRRRGPFTGDIFEQMVRASDVFGTPACVVLRRAMITARQLKFDPEIVIGPDWDFLTQFAEQADFGYVDRQTCLYRVHTGNVSNSTGKQERMRSLAMCRQKAIKLARFGSCSAQIRAFVFYDLLVNLLTGESEQQNRVIAWNEFQDLPAAERARLLRLMATRALLGGAEHRVIRDWLSKSRQTNPADRRSSLLGRLFHLHPGLCRAVIRMKSLPQSDAANAPPFTDLAPTDMNAR